MTSAGGPVGDPARSGRPSRRRFLTGALAAGAAVPILGAWGPASCRPTLPPLPPDLPDDLFALGVASGDPLPNAVVLWTRLAPAPLDGGGMPGAPVPVRWEVSEHESFRSGRRGDTVADARWAHSVHVDVTGLRPGTWYFYRFIVGDQVSPVGRTRTAPAAGVAADRLRFLFASCQNWQQGYWPLWAHAPSDDPDLVVHLGDYIYEGGISASAVRRHNSTEVRDLAGYRNRYGLYKGDPALQAAHAACPWIVTWDDHEVENNYADLVAQDPTEVPDFAARRNAAYQAWWEHMPVRLLPPVGPDLAIYRSFDWGRLARFHVVDTRQYRVPQPCTGSLGPTCPERTAPGRTLLGTEQEAWLGASLSRSPATWDVIANQIVMTSMPFAGSLYNPDQWDGYADARARALAQITAAGVDNAVVLSGDIHAAGIADLVSENPDGTPSTVAVGTEFVGGSISSTFDSAVADVAEELILQLPHVHFADTHERGYMIADITPDQMVTRYQVAESTLVPDSPVSTAGTWVTVAGTPGAQPA
ncbi:MAG TPA: alkaline phosphatase D family protein [Acidimicrobiales bacterium]|nr:alkaline phosphatase D family protein [Acidimicrobiales bacterium]